MSPSTLTMSSSDEQSQRKKKTGEENCESAGFAIFLSLFQRQKISSEFTQLSEYAPMAMHIAPTIDGREQKEKC